MHRTALIPLLGALACVPPASGQTYNTMVTTGPSTNRVDIVFIGDGYTATQVDSLYPAHVQSQVNHMFRGAQSPFPRYEQFFNVHRVNVVSAESGADKPPQGIFVDTALDASYWWDGSTERLLYFNTSLANAAVNTALAGTGIDVDMRYGTVNDSKYGGGGGSWAVYAGANSSALEVALHEVGHSFAGLADEYFTSGTTWPGGEPSEPNVTRSSATGKWDRWLGYTDPSTNIGPINYYEGGRYYEFGIYRPSNNSKMRALSRPFDAVSREQFISRIYAEVNPLDAWASNSSTLTDPPSLWVDTIDPAVIDVDWLLNGAPLEQSGETISVSSLGLVPGTYQLTAQAHDSILDHSFTGDALDWWRLTDTSPLRQTISWNVQITPAPSGDFNADGRYDCLDVDTLVAQIVGHLNPPPFDLTRDGLVNQADLTAWLAQAGAAELPSGNPYLPGDANLDGSVDGSDFSIWNSDKFMSLAAWCSGDFDASGVIDGSDFNLWNNHKFTSSDEFRAASVPEPSAEVVLLVVLGGLRRILNPWPARRTDARTRRRSTVHPQ